MALRIVREFSIPNAIDLTIVPMRRRHLPSVLQIENASFPRPWTLALFISELSQRDRVYRVARVDRKVVGYCGLIITDGQGHVTNIAVDPQWQRLKIGTSLILDLCRAAIQRGAKRMTLEVRVSNRSAQSLYYKFGFYPAGIRKNYYPETREDGLVMCADDIHSPLYKARLDTIERDITANKESE